jgi:uncharacterized protein YneF (UPF0154 family)
MSALLILGIALSHLVAYAIGGYFARRKAGA